MTAIIPAPVLWSPQSKAAAGTGWAKPGLTIAMRRGLAGRCPCCGRGRLFTGWLRQAPHCTSCLAPLGTVRADDAPPYIVIFIAAHLIIGAQVLTDAWLDLPVVAEAAIFLPLTLAVCLGLLRPIKGATIGLMLQLGLAAPAHVEP